MPSVIDAPGRIDYDAHDLQDEQPQGPVARAGFWHRVVQSVRQHRVPLSSRTPSSAHSPRRQRESSMARLAQEQPTLYLQGFLGIHNG
jgi:hypothetical protein